jgi:hypothetical protein
MKHIKYIVTSFLLIIGQFSYSQCSNCNANYPSATQSTTSNSLVTVSTCVYGGEYSNYNVTAGETYTWTTCGDSDFDTQLTLFSSGCGGTNLSYNDDDCGLQSTITWTATFTGTVTLLLSQYNCSNVSTCMTIQWACTTCGGGGGTPPANDDPCSAIALPVNSTCTNTTGTNVDATSSVGVPAPGCANYNGGDVWFTVTVPGSGNVQIDVSDAGGFTDGGMATYTGSCGSLSLLSCDDDGGTGLFPQIQETGLAPGSTVWVRVWEYGNDNFGDFNICATDAGASTANQDCNTATPICGTNAFSGNSSGGGIQELTASNQGCLSTEHESSWYTFTALTSGSISMTIAPATSDDYDFALWGPNPSCSPTSAPIRCSYAAGSDPSGSYNTGLGNGAVDNSEGVSGDNWVAPLNVVAGEVYVLLIDNFTASSNPFNLSWGGTASLDCTILPVNLLKFIAESKKNHNLLKWKTASEVNNDYYIIEKSFDGINYKQIGKVNANGNSSNVTEYDFKDKDINYDIVYYKLTQVDYNGEFENLGVVYISKEVDEISVFPNPASKELNFKFKNIDNQQYTIEYVDVTGRIVKEIIVKNNTNEVKSNVFSTLNNGFYLIKIIDSNGNIIKTSSIVKN